MNLDYNTIGRKIARQASKAFAVLVSLPILYSTATAYDSCSTEGCVPGCGSEMLTGPTQGSIYEPSEPPLQDNSADFIQQPTPPDATPSAPSAPQNYSAPFNQPQAAATPSLFSGGVEGTLTAQGAAQGHAPGYIDWAVPRTMFRLRFDAGFNNERPDRAEFFYAQCGCFGAGAPGPGSPPPNLAVNGSVDYQDLRGYVEYATNSRFSVFGEVPVRFLQASPVNATTPDTGNTGGLSDLEAGFKYALVRTPETVFTFQFKTYIPTGDARQGLGTDHVSLEPGFLAQQRVSSRLDIFGELRDWIPVNGSSLNGQNFAGNVLRYGVGAAYTVAETNRMKFSPIAEVVGWSVLDGLVLNPATGAESAETTIVNMKLGVRTMFKSNGSTLYIGYGHALTGQAWYQDIARIEYTIFL
ncbi:MAG: hypothetical protein KDB01_20940 [Planctomycetaceae bacterium]|nr:hypothetical protein [Planctomycetaceae bacterium]